MEKKIMNNTRKFLDSILSNNDTIVVAVSGGPDSMCLLHLLIEFKNKYNLKIICAHVNHNLRKESESEKVFVENYSVINNIIFEYMKIEKYKDDKFSEQEARNIRYNFFDKLIKKYNAKYLFTAHHGDDLIETILMRIVRGSNLKGYVGIPLVSKKDNYSLVRPLLYVTKDDIYKYLKDNNINYVIDKSNDSDNYTRNRYRKYVLPFLKKEEENVHLKFVKFSKELEDYYNYIDNIVNTKYSLIVKGNRVDLELLKKEDTFIQKKIIEALIEEIQITNIFNISDEQFNNIIKLIDSDNKSINLKDCFIARKSYDYLYIEKENNNKDYSYIFDNELIINNKYKFKKINKSDKKSNNIIRINSKELTLPLVIRNKKSNDKILVKNLNGHKKVNDIFIDSKIDLVKRKEYPIVTDSNNTVIWIPGLKKSIFDKEINEKYDIMIEYAEEKDE